MQDTSAKAITPILNVSDMQQSFAWFEKLGWEKGWDSWQSADFWRRLFWRVRDFSVPERTGRTGEK